MIFEDAQWADPTSIELFGRAVDRVSSLQVLLIVTFRPEFASPWIGRSHVTSLSINRLTRREAETLVNRVAGNKSVPANIRQEIIERSDGIPLFVEEMTKAVLETEGEEATERAVAAIPSPAIAVPPSLHASLMARLDRLGPAKETAQIGAAIGREFSHALLAAVARKPGRELDTALDRLIQAGLLFRQGVPPDASYLFKHALVQDAAYGTLLREPRRALHARITETVETQFPEIAESQPQLLARHCSEAGLIEKAVALWGKAGQRSVQRSALGEAIEQLTRALKQIATLLPSPALRQEEIRLQVALITPLIHTKGYAASETKAAVERARLLIEQAETLGEPPEDPLILFQVLYGAAVARMLAFDSKALSDLAGQFLALAETQTHALPLITGHRLVGNALFYTGNFTGALAQYERGLALYDPAEHRTLAARFSQDSGVTILYHRSFARWIVGYPAQALVDLDRAIKDAREIGQAATFTLMPTLSNAAVGYLMVRDHATASKLVDELFAVAKEKRTAFWQIMATALRGAISAFAGEPSSAVEILASALSTFRATGTTLFLPFALSEWAYAYAQVGKCKNAWGCIDEAATLIERTGQRWDEAEILRIAGEIAVLEPKPDAAKAEAYFRRGLAVARQQQAKSWELRAAMSLARLWRSQGKPKQARELLAPVYGWFTEGFDTRDLKEAKALLEELALYASPQQPAC